jgi:hypothetical protein
LFDLYISLHIEQFDVVHDGSNNIYGDPNCEVILFGSNIFYDIISKYGVNEACTNFVNEPCFNYVNKPCANSKSYVVVGKLDCESPCRNHVQNLNFFDLDERNMDNVK